MVAPMRSDAVAAFVVAGAAVLSACSLALDFDSREAKGDAGARPASTTPPAGGTTDGGSPGAPGPPCPSKAGPTMVRVGATCIDSTEVTNAHYAEFLAANVSPLTQPPVCLANVNFVPADNWPAPATAAAFPVVEVDWCDAFAYCAWAGKRLCGKLASGESEWTLACSGEPKRPYPYGDKFDANACITKDRPFGPVAAAAGCVGGFPGLYDMSGSVAEWEDACATDAPNAECPARGGGFTDDRDKVRCEAAVRETRLSAHEDVGFRCCSN